METCSSGEDFLIKPRKPYTITKQRERWTEEEHNRFLEALKLYGRAWQRIEEHIGTKTAVQIRSHAQKFFTKLEKEASIKGIPVGQTVDIDIPPPRPKRKPSNPYPRKTCLSINSSPKEGKGDTSSMSNSSSSPNKDMTNRTISEKRTGNKAVEIANKARENGDFSEILTLFQDTPCSSSTVKNGFKSPIVFREFVPLPKEVHVKTKADKILVNDQEKEDPIIPEECDAELTNMTIGRLKDIDIGSGVNIASAENRSNQTDVEGLSVKKQSLCEHFVEDDNEKDGQSSHADTNSVPCLSNQIGAPPNPHTFTLPPFSGTPVDHTNQATPFVYHQLPTFTPPVGMFPNHQDAYKFLFNISSSFSNLILSTLLQNPSAHAAATFAASYWPNFNVERTTDPPPSIFPSAVPGGNDNSTPNLASIAAATVAAATAWWATHGLLPLWHPPSANAFGFGPHPAHTVPTTTASKPQLYQKETADNGAQTLQQQTQLVPDADSPEDVLMQRSMSKSSPSSYSEGSKGAERSQGVDLKSPVIIELDSTPETGLHESSSNMREPKQGPHPCTLNRQSSSDVEKVGDTKQESELSKLTYPLDSDINSRRSRSSVNYVGESWKEVSEEGRIAFQALFSREVLPQSFSPPPSAANMHFGNGIERGSFDVDLNSKLHADTEHDQNRDGCIAVKRSDDQHDDSISSSGMQLKFKAHRTGFKPYKRCSMEASATGMVREEEKSNKRLHVESKASNL